MEILHIALYISVLLMDYGHSSYYDGLNLELVQVLFRHGQRTPQKIEINLLNKVNRSTHDFYGYGQLTNVGKQQMYRFGDMLRQRYRDFLGDSFKPDDVYACSSEIDRTKVSLQLVLASLFPPIDDQIWNENLKWMPLPIHFIPIELDMFFNSLDCSEFQNIRSKIMNLSEVRWLLSQHEDLFDLLNVINPSVDFDLEKVFYFNNLLKIQESLNVPQPNWYTRKVASKLNAAAKLYLDINCYTPKMIRFNNGLMRQMLENVNVNGTTSNSHKVYLFSGHEFNVYAFAKGHGLTLDDIPGYGSAFIMEKYRDYRGRIFLKLYLWSAKAEELELIKFRNCGEYCSIDDYQIIVKNSLPSDDEMRCMLKNLTLKDLQMFLSLNSETL